jgi:hypothetical protein
MIMTPAKGITPAKNILNSAHNAIVFGRVCEFSRQYLREKFPRELMYSMLARAMDQSPLHWCSKARQIARLQSPLDKSRGQRQARRRASA